MAAKQAAPEHPGVILQRDFLGPLALSQNALALAIGVSAPTVNGIIRGRHGITPKLALRLGRYFHNGPEFWMGLQQQFDIAEARKDIQAELSRRVHPIDRALMEAVPA